MAAAIMLGCGVLVTPAVFGEGSRVTAAAIIAVALGLAARLVHTGLFVGPPGIRIRTMWRTSTYEWLRIDDFATVRDHDRTALVLQLVGGSTVATPIAIERDTRGWRLLIERRDIFAAARPLMGTVTLGKLVANLRHRLAEARASQST